MLIKYELAKLVLFSSIFFGVQVNANVKCQRFFAERDSVEIYESLLTSAEVFQSRTQGSRMRMLNEKFELSLLEGRTVAIHDIVFERYRARFVVTIGLVKKVDDKVMILEINGVQKNVFLGLDELVVLPKGSAGGIKEFNSITDSLDYFNKISAAGVEVNETWTFFNLIPKDSYVVIDSLPDYWGRGQITSGRFIKPTSTGVEVEVNGKVHEITGIISIAVMN